MVSEHLKKSYYLVASVSAEYERDRKPRPSGYAKVRLTLKPYDDESVLDVVINVNLDKDWRLLEFQSYTDNQILPVSQEVEEGLQGEAVTGISEGAKTALQSYLDAPVEQVKIVVDEIIFHPMYSTIAAFKVASERAVELALDKARQQGLLITKSEGEDKPSV